MDSRTGKRLRLARILSQDDGRAMVVAYSHGVFRGALPGMRTLGEMRRMVEKLRTADAIMLSPGMVRHLEDAFLGKGRPALIIQADWMNVGRPPDLLGYAEGCSVAMLQAEEALAAGADAIMSYLWLGASDPDHEKEEIARNAAYARACERLGLPLIIESRAIRQETEAGRVNVKLLKLHTRIAAELGADLIKTKYSGDVESFAEVVAECPVPVLVAGGERKSTLEEALAIGRDALTAGAAGLVFGRNIVQDADPEAALARFLALVHGKGRDTAARGNETGAGEEETG